MQARKTEIQEDIFSRIISDNDLLIRDDASDVIGKHISFYFLIQKRFDIMHFWKRHLEASLMHLTGSKHIIEFSNIEDPLSLYVVLSSKIDLSHISLNAFWRFILMYEFKGPVSYIEIDGLKLSDSSIIISMDSFPNQSTVEFIHHVFDISKYKAFDFLYRVSHNRKREVKPSKIQPLEFY